MSRRRRRRRACGSGIARTTASAASPSTVGPGPTRSTRLPELDRQPLGERGDQAAQPAGRGPADGPRSAAALPAPTEHGQLRRPRPGQARRPPPGDDLRELGVADGEVGRAQVDRAALDPLARHPAADGAGPVDDAHLDPRRAELDRTRDPGDARPDHHHSHRRRTLGPAPRRRESAPPTAQAASRIPASRHVRRSESDDDSDARQGADSRGVGGTAPWRGPRRGGGIMGV